MSNMICHDVRKLTSRTCLRRLALVAVISGSGIIIAPAEGALRNQYNFAEGVTNNATGRTIIDSVGGMNGTVIGPAGAGLNPSATANALVLPGGTSDIAPYVDLPNGMVSSLTNATFEGWYKLGSAQNWGRIFDFGSTDVNPAPMAVTGGEITGPGGGGTDLGEGLDYIQFAATRGTNQNQQRGGMRNNDALFLGSGAGTVAGGEALADPNVATTLGTRKHFSLVYNATGGSGATPASLTAYVDGVPRATTNTAIQLGNLNDVNNWLGRSNWLGDSNFGGSLEEFRIYDHAMTQTEVHQRFVDGPTGPAPPTVELNRDTGAITLINQDPSVRVVGYTLTSNAGTLNSANWRPIADNADANSGGSFDPNHVWTKLTLAGSTQDFSEIDFSGGSGPFGGVFGAGGTTSYQLGTGGGTESQRAWRRSFYEDIAIQLKLDDPNAPPVPVTVKYVGNNGVLLQRSDLNFDGVINLADWNLFLTGNGANLSILTMHESYQRGDVNGDLANNYQDFRLFKADFDVANGAGAFVAMTGVPEPATLTMLALGCAALLSPRRRSAVRRCVSQPCDRTIRHTKRMSLLLTSLSLLMVLVGFARQSEAALRNRYSFNEGVTANASGRTVIDSVGGRNGTVIGPIMTGINPSATATQLVLPGGEQEVAPYVDLPNGLVSSLSDATFEGWYTLTGTQAWSRVFDFGSTDPAVSTGGELNGPGTLTGTDGAGQDFFFMSPVRGTNLAQQRVGFGNQQMQTLGGVVGNAGAGIYTDVDREFTHVLGTQFHMAVVVDADGGGPGIATQALYINGAPAPDAEGIPGPVNSAHQLANLNDVNNWLGRSNWTADDNFQGSFNEFRIYDHALSAVDISKNFVFGPDTTLTGDVLTLEVNKTTGQVRLINQQSVPVNIDYYEITSAGGALNTGGWNSLDDQETGDPAGQGWDESGGASANQLSELFLGDGNASFAFPASGSRALGNAFNPAIFGANDGDLVFQFGLPSGGILPGTVTYVTGGPAGVAGDYNNNGTVDAADYVLWRNGGPLQNDTTPATIGPEDYNVWRANFGKSPIGAASSASVPEPSLLASFVCCVAGIATWLARSRRR
jgi:hypothetical protein